MRAFPQHTILIMHTCRQTHTHTDSRSFLLILCPAKWSHRNWGSRECVLFAGKTIEPSPVHAHTRAHKQTNQYTALQVERIQDFEPFYNNGCFCHTSHFTSKSKEQQTPNLFTPIFPAKLFNLEFNQSVHCAKAGF